MSQRRNDITRLLSLILTSLLLIMAVGGSAWTTAQQPAGQQTVESTRKAAKNTDHTHDAVLKAASFEAVVTPAVSFGFAQVVYLLPPAVQLLLIEQPKIPRLFDVPYFYFSYFQHVFGHHIATNAP